jgi:coenzyme F420-reducing hydrogenase delta subunit/NAD-dependent dihydropyrimidine dehydrogenase PreA subunit
VNPRFCTGCEQCYHDCPFEAISMVPRDDERDGYVAFVDPGKCVSCGICAGSCAPMSVGPPERTGRDQLQTVKAFIAATTLSPEEVVLVGCAQSAGGVLPAGDGRGEEPAVYGVSCVGAVHTSVIEYLVRAGAGGVMVVACPPRDCWNREGVRWLEERIFNAREAELKERVDRRRVRVVYAAEYERRVLAREIEAFRDEVRALDGAVAESGIEIDTVCETPEVSVAAEEVTS